MSDGTDKRDSVNGEDESASEDWTDNVIWEVFCAGAGLVVVLTAANPFVRALAAVYSAAFAGFAVRRVLRDRAKKRRRPA
ncbi:hypothetical protein GL263_13905 [Streptomyces durbertensis]|uniref:Uncharacterized protein n=1 Tax=Streptomyces durbertensis TaxID=2448886 RepID=A0ABR6EH43_9ACTN|nr:hypothetical protein [Streptomyces durbertensis]MBB1244651.1 hypothetical protein [Streptomyces durbertensis]